MRHDTSFTILYILEYTRASFGNSARSFNSCHQSIDSKSPPHHVMFRQLCASEISCRRPCNVQKSGQRSLYSCPSNFSCHKPRMYRYLTNTTPFPIAVPHRWYKPHPSPQPTHIFTIPLTCQSSTSPQLFSIIVYHLYPHRTSSTPCKPLYIYIQSHFPFGSNRAPLLTYFVRLTTSSRTSSKPVFASLSGKNAIASAAVRQYSSASRFVFSIPWDLCTSSRACVRVSFNSSH